MVHMGMSQKNIINACLIKRKLGIFKHINALLHTVIHEDALFPNFKAVTASRHFMICTDKR